MPKTSKSSNQKTQIFFRQVSQNFLNFIQQFLSQFRIDAKLSPAAEKPNLSYFLIIKGRCGL